MTVSIMDGHTGANHISSYDWSIFNEATYGTKTCVFDYEDKLKLTMTSTTSGTIGVGAGLVEGRRFIVESAHSVTFKEVSSNSKRTDLVVARYTSTNSIESVELVVISGTEGTDTVPTANEGDFALWRVQFTNSGSGTTFETKQLYSVFTPINATLTQEAAESTYLKKTDAANTYRKQTDTVSIANGGTGQTTVAAARNALGLGNTSGAVPIANGGTGATTAANARSNLGAAASSHNHDAGNITSGAVSIARGGTGATTAANARSNLGITPANIGAAVAPKVLFSSTSGVQGSSLLENIKNFRVIEVFFKTNDGCLNSARAWTNYSSTAYVDCSVTHPTSVANTSYMKFAQINFSGNSMTVNYCRETAVWGEGSETTAKDCIYVVAVVGWNF